jgi:hypothetical protein
MAVSAFRPFKGDLLLVEYSTNQDTSNINIHSVSPLNSQDMDEVIDLHVVLSWVGSCLSFLLIPFLDFLYYVWQYMPCQSGQICTPMKS